MISDYDSLAFIQSYLSERQQRTKGNDTCSTYSDILYNIPQGSILGSLIFNIYMSDIFLSIDKCDITSYADGNTPYTSYFTQEEVIEKLQLITDNLFEWLKNRQVKCRLLYTRETDVTAKIRDLDVKKGREEKLIDIKIDNKFSFENPVSSLCKKASQKLYALTHTSSKFYGSNKT